MCRASESRPHLPVRHSSNYRSAGGGLFPLAPGANVPCYGSAKVQHIKTYSVVCSHRILLRQCLVDPNNRYCVMHTYNDDTWYINGQKRICYCENVGDDTLVCLLTPASASPQPIYFCDQHLAEKYCTVPHTGFQHSRGTNNFSCRCSRFQQLPKVQYFKRCYLPAPHLSYLLCLSLLTSHNLLKWLWQREATLNTNKNMGKNKRQHRQGIQN